MVNSISKEKLSQFDLIVKSLSTAIKSSIMYFSAHPIRFASIESLLDAIETWFKNEIEFVLEVDPGSLLLEGTKIDEEGEVYQELAKHLYSRGIKQVIFSHGVDAGELSDFLDILKKDPDNIKSRGGVSELLSINPTINVREITPAIAYKRKPGEHLLKRSLDFSPEDNGNDIMPIDTGVRLGDLVHKFRDTMDEGRMAGEMVRLILNLLWLEEDPGDFERLAAKIRTYLPKVVERSDTRTLKNIVKFFSEKIDDKNVRVDLMQKTARDVIEMINNSVTTEDLISLVPESNISSLENISGIFSSKPVSDKIRLIDAYIFEDDPFIKDKYSHIFSKMGENISAEISTRLGTLNENIENSKGLFRILRLIDSGKASKISRMMLKNGNPSIRFEALSGFLPDSPEEIEQIMDIVLKDRDGTVQGMAIRVIVSTGNWEYIDKLFSYTKKNIRLKRHMLMLVKLCGDYRISEAIHYLKQILFKKTLINTSGLDEIRMACVISLSQIHTPEALDIVREGLKIKRSSIRDLCKMVLRSGD